MEHFHDDVIRQVAERDVRFIRLWFCDIAGTLKLRRAVAEAVTHVRWLLSDPAHPGQAGRFSYRATLR